MTQRRHTFIVRIWQTDEPDATVPGQSVRGSLQLVTADAESCEPQAFASVAQIVELIERYLDSGVGSA